MLLPDLWLDIPQTARVCTHLQCYLWHVDCYVNVLRRASTRSSKNGRKLRFFGYGRGDRIPDLFFPRAKSLILHHRATHLSPGYTVRGTVWRTAEQASALRQNLFATLVIDPAACAFQLRDLEDEIGQTHRLLPITQRGRRMSLKSLKRYAGYI